MRRLFGLLFILLAAPVCASSSDDRASSGETVNASEIALRSGLRYVELKPGTGEVARPGDTVEVHYTGWLANGKKFDSSLDRGQAFVFKLGAGQVIKGWEEGLAGMRVGGKRKLIIPPALGYGQNGAGGIVPPNAVMIFEVELLRVQ